MSSVPGGSLEVSVKVGPVYTVKCRRSAGTLATAKNITLRRSSLIPGPWSGNETNKGVAMKAVQSMYGVQHTVPILYAQCS